MCLTLEIIQCYCNGSQPTKIDQPTINTYELNLTIIRPLVLVVVCGVWCDVNILLYCFVLLLKIAAHNPKKWERYSIEKVTVKNTLTEWVFFKNSIQ
jgi:hypothetical protein